MSTTPPPGTCLVAAQDLAQARNLHHHSKYTECAALLLTAAPGAEDAASMLAAALRGVKQHSRRALGVSDEAGAAEAKKAYRKLALKLHPDKTQGATSELFAALTEAHRAVASEAKRRARRGEDTAAAPPDKAAAAPPPRRKSKPKPRKAPPSPEPPAPTRVDLDEHQDADENWEKRFWDLAAFKLKQGNCYPDPATPLGAWCSTQRRAREAGKLSGDRRQRLEQLGFAADDDSWRAKAAAAAPTEEQAAQAYWRRSTSERKTPDRAPPRRRASEAPSRRTRLDDALSGVAASLPGRRRPTARVSPPDRSPPARTSEVRAPDRSPAAQPVPRPSPTQAVPPPPPPRARPPTGAAGCMGPSEGVSWSRSRASTAAETRTETSTREFTLFGYVVARYEVTSAYGQPANES